MYLFCGAFLCSCIVCRMFLYDIYKHKYNDNVRANIRTCVNMCMYVPVQQKEDFHL